MRHLRHYFGEKRDASDASDARKQTLFFLLFTFKQLIMNEIDKIRKYLEEKEAQKQALKQPYRKPESIRQLERLHFETKKVKHPNIGYDIQKIRTNSRYSNEKAKIRYSISKIMRNQ